MNCDEFQSRLSERDELRAQSRVQLERHAETCAACRTKLEEHRALMAGLRTLSSPQHVEGERLTRFAIQRAAPSEPDYDQSRLSGFELHRIEGHVRQCPRCRLAVESIMSQYEEMDRFLTEAGVPPIPITIEKPPTWVFARIEADRVWSRAKRTIVSPLSYPTAGVAFGALLLVLWTGPWLRDPYYALSVVEPTETSFLTRDSSSALTRGIELMNEGRYSEATSLLEPFADGAADDRLRSYAHYLSGLAWVYEARTEVFGRVLNYSGPRLDRAIAHLETVTESSDSGRVREDAYWLLGKAYLMKQDPVRAREAFGAVERIEGRRSDDARQLIQAIAKLKGS